MKIAILGAGVAGLASALELKKQDPNTKISIFEQNSQPGGLMQCTYKDHYQWDNGVFMFQRNSYLHQLLPDVLQPIDDFGQEIVLKNRIQPFPFSFKSLIKGHSLFFLFTTALDYLFSAVMRYMKKDQKNLQKWLRFRLTKKLYKDSLY